MTCDCIENIDAGLKDRGVCLSVLHQLDGKPSIAAVALIRLDKYVIENRRGKPKDMAATFCPWCGVRYEDELGSAP